jgi:hypothetical protein
MASTQDSTGGTDATLHLTGQLDEYAAVAMVSKETATAPTFLSFLERMRNFSATPLGPLSVAQVPSFAYKFNVNGDVLGAAEKANVTSPIQMSLSQRSEPPALATTPWVDKVHVPLTHGFQFQVQVIGSSPASLAVTYPFGPKARPKLGVPTAIHSNLAVGAFDIDKYPITNAEYAAFLAASNYTPVDPINFLKSWGGKRTPPVGSEKQPVVNVGFDDAASYCSFFRRRLPNEWEWSLAAGALDGRRWPWGNISDTSNRCMPPTYNGLSSPPLPDVDHYDNNSCAAPSGMQLSVGIIWQWTNSQQDAHQRTGLIKGGSSYWRSNVTSQRSFYFFPC